MRWAIWQFCLPILYFSVIFMGLVNWVTFDTLRYCQWLALAASIRTTNPDQWDLSQADPSWNIPFEFGSYQNKFLALRFAFQFEGVTGRHFCKHGSVNALEHYPNIHMFSLKPSCVQLQSDFLTIQFQGNILSQIFAVCFIHRVDYTLEF